MKIALIAHDKKKEEIIDLAKMKTPSQVEAEFFERVNL